MTNRPGDAGQRDDSHPRRDGAGRHEILSRSSEWFQNCELFIPGIFYLIFSERGLLWVIETSKSKTADKGGRLHAYGANVAKC